MTRSAAALFYVAATDTRYAVDRNPFQEEVMTATEPRVFNPNAVFIPASALPDNTASHSAIDPAECTLLYLDGDRNGGELYTREQWQSESGPAYRLRDDHYYAVSPGGEETLLCPAGLSIKDQEPVVGDRIQLLPEMFVVKMDETEYWDEEFRNKCGVKRIFGVYAFNRRKVCYLCEITPSYELVFLGSQWEGNWNPEGVLDEEFDEDEYQRRADEADAEIRKGDASTEEFSYQHCSDVDRMLQTKIKRVFFPPEGKSGGYPMTDIASVTEEDALEEIREVWNTSEL